MTEIRISIGHMSVLTQLIKSGKRNFLLTLFFITLLVQKHRFTFFFILQWAYLVHYTVSMHRTEMNCDVLLENGGNIFLWNNISVSAIFHNFFVSMVLLKAEILSFIGSCGKSTEKKVAITKGHGCPSYDGSRQGGSVWYTSGVIICLFPYNYLISFYFSLF